MIDKASEMQPGGPRPGLRTIDIDSAESAAPLSTSHSACEESTPLINRETPHSGPSSRGNVTMERIVSRGTLLLENVRPHFWEGVLHECGRLGELMVPLIASSMSAFLISMIGVAFVGHLGKWELSVVVLAASLFNVFGVSFLIGSLGALETLCGQAYGAKNYKAMGIILQRAMLFTLVLASAVALSWSKIETLMLFLGQNATLSAAAARYLHWSTPALFFVASADCLKRFLTSQNVMLPATVASIVAMLCAPFFYWMLVFKFHLGLFGAAIAGNIAQATPFVIMLAWTMKREQTLKLTNSPMATWQGFSIEALKDWNSYTKLAFPSAAMVCLEWWTFEACVILSGWLENPELEVAVMGLTLNVSGLLYMLPLGLGAATSVRVSNALGAGLPRAAARAGYIATTGAAMLQCLLAIVTLVSRKWAAYIFTDDEQVAESAAAVFPIMAWCLLGDGINATVGGVLRGAGRQELGAIFNLIAYWAIGLPLAYMLAFKLGWSVWGLWVGLATCASFNGMVMLVILSQLDWNAESRRAESRTIDPEDCNL